MFCVHCGAKLDEGAQFCGSCGMPVEQGVGGSGPAGNVEGVPRTANLHTQAQHAPQPSPYVQATQQHQAIPVAKEQVSSKPKGGVPVIPIVIAAIAVAAIILIVMFVVKPGAQPAASSADSQPAANSSQQAPSASASASTDKFIGDWKLGGMETQGISMCGNVAEVLGFNAALMISKDGTGSINLDDANVTFDWKQSNDDAITLSSLKGDEDSNILDEAVNVSYREETLAFEISADDMNGSLIFSKDGSVKWMNEIEMDDAKKISSADVLNGTTWNLSGLTMNGVTMRGDAEAIKEFMPSSMTSTSVKFKKDGTVSFMGEDLTWKITEKGNAVIMEGSSKVLIKSLGNDIVMDLSDFVALDMALLFSKA
ncbi:MAG: zinc ribbon domain-containing protein [Eggerthellaceae bacterium]|nr:zinc ribbon domain-containing protein [Eggerthellaceae bacterium]